MALSSPVLNASAFQKQIDGADSARAGWASPPAQGAPAPPGVGRQQSLRAAAQEPDKAMTLAGTFTATAVLFVFLFGAGLYGWGAVTQTRTEVPDPRNIGATVTQISTNFPGWIWASLLVALGLAFLTIFKPKLARVTAILYAVAEGLAVGAISHAYNFQYDGIVVQAVLATAAVFASMLFLYVTRIVKVTQRFTRIIMGAMMGVLLLYVGSMLAGLFGVNLTFYRQPTPLGIGISLLIIGVAAFSLMLDFDFIENAVEAKAPSYMEWYAGFGLMVGLVWLYLEILRLLSMLRSR